MAAIFSKAHLPQLGAGIGFRPQLKSGLFRQHSKVPWVEIIAEHYIGAAPAKMEELQLLLDHFTVIPHGIHLSIGSAEGPDPRHLENLAALIEQLNPPWWSEHLAFVRSGERHIGHLSPLPFTQEAIDVVGKNAETIRKFISTPLILENITYLVKIPGAEMTEGQFVKKALEAAGAGSLLDLTNVYTNATNHGYSPIDFIDQFPMEKVVQCHVVGGHWEGDLLHDSHSHPVPEAVWDLLIHLQSKTSVHGVLLERDEHIPPFAELMPEIQRAQSILDSSPS